MPSLPAPHSEGRVKRSIHSALSVEAKHGLQLANVARVETLCVSLSRWHSMHGHVNVEGKVSVVCTVDFVVRVRGSQLNNLQFMSLAFKKKEDDTDKYRFSFVSAQTFFWCTNHGFSPIGGPRRSTFPDNQLTLISVDTGRISRRSRNRSKAMELPSGSGRK